MISFVSASKISFDFISPDSYSDVLLKHTIKKTLYGDLATSNDWTVLFELPELKEFSIKHFPQDICQTTKQVHAFVISRSRKIFFVGPELTVPIEERIAFWNKEKTAKYMRK